MSPSDIVAEFFASTRTLKQVELDWLVKKEVAPLTLAFDADGGGYVVGSAHVIISGRLFDFGDMSEPGASTALVFVARDRTGDACDLVAWLPRSDRIAAYFGRTGLLGEQSLFEPRISDPPAIHRGLLDWLRLGRDGCVVVEPTRAARALLDAPGRLAVGDIAHAGEIAKLLTSTVDLTRIVVPATVREAA
jgi:hypothetical protein